MIKRDENGLIEGVEYKFRPDGSIDWQLMLKPEHLYINRDYKNDIEKRFNLSLKEIDVTLLEKREVLITLEGINYLAWLRGRRSIIPDVKFVSETEVTSTVTVTFISNFEDPDGLVVGAQASANVYSVSGKFQPFLATFAQNRAFVRAVRQALRIESLGKDEFDAEASQKHEEAVKNGFTLVKSNIPPVSEPSESKYSGPMPHDALAKACIEKGYTFEDIRKSASGISNELVEGTDPAQWVGFESIEPLNCFTLIGKLQDAPKKKKKQNG